MLPNWTFLAKCKQGQTSTKIYVYESVDLETEPMNIINTEYIIFEYLVIHG